MDEPHDDDPGAGCLDFVGALAVTVMALGTIAMVTGQVWPW